MSTVGASTRRAFLSAGALAAAPLGAAAPAWATEHDQLRARAARLEDEAALRDLHQGWLRQFNRGALEPALPVPDGGDAFAGVRTVTPDLAGAPDTFDMAPDGRGATGRFDCLVQIETEIPRTSTLAQMAHAQGEGFARRTERRTLVADYLKTSDGWTIAALELLNAS